MIGPKTDAALSGAIKMAMIMVITIILMPVLMIPIAYIALNWQILAVAVLVAIGIQLAVNRIWPKGHRNG